MQLISRSEGFSRYQGDACTEVNSQTMCPILMLPLTFWKSNAFFEPDGGKNGNPSCAWHENK
jgi:hypothetical protein